MCDAWRLGAAAWPLCPFDCLASFHFSVPCSPRGSAPIATSIVLVEFERGNAPGYFELSAMEAEPSEMLGRKADSRTPEELSRYFATRSPEPRPPNMNASDRVRLRHMLDAASEALFVRRRPNARGPWPGPDASAVSWALRGPVDLPAEWPKTGGFVDRFCLTHDVLVSPKTASGRAVARMPYEQGNYDCCASRSHYCMFYLAQKPFCPAADCCSRNILPSSPPSAGSLRSRASFLPRFTHTYGEPHHRTDSARSILRRP